MKADVKFPFTINRTYNLKSLTPYYKKRDVICGIPGADSSCDKLPIAQKFKLLGNGEFNHSTNIPTLPLMCDSLLISGAQHMRFFTF